MRKILRGVELSSEWVGSAARWLVVALVIITIYDVVARYVFNAPTEWGYETVSMLGGSIIILGWAYVQLHHSHIRVDVLYSRLSSKRQAIIDILGFLIFFVPFSILFLKSAVEWTIWSWSTQEVMTESYWYPPASPFRTVILIGGLLMFFQFLTQFIGDLRMLTKGK